ncbi:PDI related protein A [Aaosphaeria arxii CBS 175.79]|uniref:protein disulfide-isomerase n=1 Tax=Aaosphaeria arxii CBS 175.79 TaxID=1450172 RepID=A0A6A5XMC5_9PLEO|nr:PDI related protein A [Aaosphaeria arxii CBS 175.79]KAF2013484.1 PDI related protein A [Aaosphaeria arxii CBS 175.79]
MVRSTSIAAAAASFALCAHAGSFYSKNSPVLQLNGMDYDRVIAKSNYTSIVEFYAPWCGHCQNLKPAYENAAKSLAGIAKVAAVNCDEEINKPFCGQMGVQGFPTLKIVRPGKKPGKPTVEDYQGPRNAKGIAEAVKDKIPNTVKRITDKNLGEWLQENAEAPKAILFSDKGAISATLRTVAIDFAGLIPIAQIRSNQQEAVQKYGISKFPALILIPGDGKDPITFDGEVKKDAIVDFLSQAATPNPDCPPPKGKKSKKDSKKDGKKDGKKASKSSSSVKPTDASPVPAASESVEEPIKPSESPDANLKDEDTPEPVVIPTEEAKPTIPVVSETAELQISCLNDKSLTCILALLPKEETSEAAVAVTDSLASIHKKHGDKLFPFIGVPASNPLASSIRTELALGGEDAVHLIATHGKRAWYKKYPGSTFGPLEVEQWVDAIRMGEGKKEKLPESLIAQQQSEAKEEKVAEEEPIKINIADIPVEEPKKDHDEL